MFHVEHSWGKTCSEGLPFPIFHRGFYFPVAVPDLDMFFLHMFFLLGIVHRFHAMEAERDAVDGLKAGPCPTSCQI
jgi:hypothetical protein